MAASTSSKLQDFSTYTSLVLVCCHATFVGDETAPLHDEQSWILQPFQQSDPATGKPSEISTFISHVVVGAVQCIGDPNTLLMFSGGRTTHHNRSEAQSYRRVFSILRKQGHAPPAVCALEEEATDSYQNLLFSIIRFREVVGRYPERITVITHAFKERRFLELHASAIKWPASRIRVQGINPPFSLEELQHTQTLELKNGYRPFEQDPYGAHPPLVQKRIKRNWDQSVTASWDVEDSVRQLIEWTGGESGKQVFPHSPPWQES